MVLEVGDDGALIEILTEALKAKNQREGRSVSLRLRRERREEYLEVAEKILGENRDPTVENHELSRRSDSVQVRIGEHLIPVFVGQYTQLYNDEVAKTTALVVGLPNGEEGFLFSVEKRILLYTPRPTTIIRDHFGRIASNEQVFLGLKAIQFIAGRMGK